MKKTYKTYTVSLSGLGYKATSAVVTGEVGVEDGEHPFEILEGLPTLKNFQVKLDVSSDEDKWAISAAKSIAFSQFQKEMGINF